MPFKVQVGPHQVAIHHGQTVLVSEPDGQINWPSEKGLYFFDTRVVSSWTIYANGEPWSLLNGGAITYYASRTYLTNRNIRTPDGMIAERTLGLVISRLINNGMHEDLDITNNGMKRVRFQLEIAVRCDFADIFEVKSNNIVRRGQITTEWSQTQQQLRTATKTAISSAPSRLCPLLEDRTPPMPTAGSALKSISIPGRPGTAACSTRSRTVSGCLCRQTMRRPTSRNPACRQHVGLAGLGAEDPHQQ